MKFNHLSHMTKGWFAGAFEPNAYKTNDVEVAVKRFAKGATEEAHYHKIATEITVVVSGTVRMFNRIWKEDDIVIAEPGDITSFEAITDAVLTVLKIPGALNDKYLSEKDRE